MCIVISQLITITYVNLNKSLIKKEMDVYFIISMLFYFHSIHFYYTDQSELDFAGILSLGSRYSMLIDFKF